MDEKSPVDFFNLFFTDKVKQIIYEETIRYANQETDKENAYLMEHPHARGNNWQRNPLTFQEINPFLAIIITMGIIGLPTIRYYENVYSNKYKITSFLGITGAQSGLFFQ